MPQSSFGKETPWGTELRALTPTVAFDNDGYSLRCPLSTSSLEDQPLLLPHSPSPQKKPDQPGAFDTSTSSSRLNHQQSHTSYWFKHNVLRSGAGTQDSQPLQQTWFERQYGISGWRVGVLVSCICVAFCLCLETILLIAAVSISRPGVAAQGILMEGSCANVKKYNIVLLIPINIIATIIISCSNYVMQCMSAPSRKDLDRAHDLGYHVHIGVSSARNNFHNGTIRQLSWWLIGATSIPIHLMLNPVVFAILRTNNYLVTIVGPSFLEDSTWSVCEDSATTTNDSSTSQICAVRQTLVERPDTYKTYSLDQCIRTYSDNIQAEASNVFVLTNSTLQWNDFDWSKQSDANKTIHVPVPQSELIWDVDTFHGAYTAMEYRVLATMQELKYESTNSSMVDAQQFDPNSWLCDAHSLADTGRACTMGGALARLSNFTITPAAIPIYECRAQKAEQHCSLEYSVITLAITIGSDAVKLIAMLLFFRRALRHNKSRHSDDDLIATLGDAVQSYLKRPDPNTVKRCLMDQVHIRYQTRLMTDPNNHRSINLPMPLPWNITKRRWASVPSTSRWCCFLLPFGGLAASTAVILYWNVSSLHNVTIYDIWAQGLGKVDPNAVFASSTFNDRSVLRGAITVNTPQLLFSYLYLVYNGLFTCMHIGKEWGQFAKRPTLLRVSRAQGRQRWTYWLSLPWRYNVPLIVVSALLHWLVPRSLYLVRINVFGPDGKPQPDLAISAYGFSPLATILVMSILVLVLLTVFAFSMRTLEPGTIMVGTNSFAISAACPDDGGEKDAALKPLTWGVVREGNEDGELGHATITSRTTSKLIDGWMYQ